MRLQILLLIVLILMSMGCDNEKNLVNYLENSSYFPLKVGNTWKFTVIDYRIPVNDTSETTFSIVGTKTIEQMEYYILKGGPKIFWPPIFMDRLLMGFDTLLLRQNELGHLMLRTPEGEVPYFIFDKSLINSHRQFYINKNKFEVVVLGIDDIQREMIVAGLDSTVRNFPREYKNCFHIVVYLPEVMGAGAVSWFAPGIGMVFIHYPEYNVDYILTEAYINNAWIPFP